MRLWASGELASTAALSIPTRAPALSPRSAPQLATTEIAATAAQAPPHRRLIIAVPSPTFRRMLPEPADVG